MRLPIRDPFELPRRPLLDPLAGFSPAPVAPVAPLGSPRSLLDFALTCAALGENGPAFGALRQAIAVRPDLAEAWHALAALLTLEGDAQGAAEARGMAARAVEPEGRRAARTSSAGKLEAGERKLREAMRGASPQAAEAFLRDALRKAPTDFTAMRLLADIMLAGGRNAEAERLLQRALDIAPAVAALRHAYAIALYRGGKEAEAIPHVERLLAQEPSSIAYRTLLASALAMIGDIDRAIALYAGILRSVPRDPDLWISYGQALKHAGRKPESVQAFRTCLDIAPATGEAWWSLENLTSAPASDADVAAMRDQLRAGRLTAANRFHFHYALAYALEKRGEYDESFTNYDTGSKIWRGQIAYSADEISARVKRARAIFTKAFFDGRADFGDGSAAPIFIVGMPRAGSTLIEQILASHSKVEGTQELPTIGHITSALDGIAGGYPACLEHLDKDDVAALTARYIDRTRIYRKTDKPLFIDKMPANWADTGLIALMFPRAKIIDARRDPMANCFAAYKKYFGHGLNFTYDQVELGRYYCDYLALMSHFDTALPGRVHRVRYEEMVADTDSEIRKLLAYCELEFEPACARFWETTRTVSTASSEQVRRPIYREGLDLWRHYEQWLGPLQATLRGGGA